MIDNIRDRSMATPGMFSFPGRSQSETDVHRLVGTNLEQVNHMEQGDSNRENRSTEPIQYIQITQPEGNPSKSGPSIKPQNFTGAEDWEIYITHFEVCAKLGRWNAHDKALALMASLREEAQSYCLTLHEDDRQSYERIVLKMGQRFGKARLQTTWMTRFESRLKGPSESFAKLADDIWRLTQRAYPSMTRDTQEMLALNQLYKSVPPEVKFKCLTEQCSSIDQAIAVIEMYEGVFNTIGSNSNSTQGARTESARAVQQEQSANDQIEKTLEKLQTCINQFNSQNKQKPNIQYQEPRRCYNCKALGHFIRDCPYKMNTNLNSGGYQYNGENRQMPIQPY